MSQGLKLYLMLLLMLSIDAAVLFTIYFIGLRIGAEGKGLNALVGLPAVLLLMITFFAGSKLIEDLD